MDGCDESRQQESFEETINTMSEADEVLQTLYEALQSSPDNIALRGQYAKLLMARGRLQEAEEVLRAGLKHSPQSEQLKLGLADCSYRLGNTSVALVILEELTGRPDCNPAASLLYAKALLTQGQLEAGARAYQKAVAADPSLVNEDLAQVLGVSESQDPWQDDPDVDEQGRMRMRYEEDVADEPAIEMERPHINFDDVGGMDALKEQIRFKIIEPLKNPEIYKAYGKAVGGSILMYGPPGCGKTYLARATAGQVDATFINVGLHHVLDMYIGNSEQRLHTIFQTARQNTPCILFFDEVDALGASRSDLRKSAGRNLINQFLSELDGIESDNEGILILAATNAPWHLDPAFRRPGRFDRLLFVPPPDAPARTAILRILLRDKPQKDILYDQVAKKTDKFSGADLKAVIDQAIELKLNEALAQGIPSPLGSKDLLKAAKAVKPSTGPWFSSARNYALYANEGGIYDDILDYLNIKL